MACVLKLAYKPPDERLHLKTALTLPGKWLRPETRTRVARVLDVFAKTYNARIVGHRLDPATLALVEPRSWCAYDRETLLDDALREGAADFEVVEAPGSGAEPPRSPGPIGVLAPKRKPTKKKKEAAAAEKAEKAPAETAETAPAPRSDAAALEILRRLEKGLGANFEGEFFPTEGAPPERAGGRAGQEDQPTVAEHARRPDCAVGMFEINFSGTMYNGVGYHSGPGEKKKLGVPPPIARHGMVFKGLVDPRCRGYVRVLEEHGAAYDGLWLPLYTEDFECIKRVADDHDLLPPRPRTPPVKGPLAPEVKAAWDAYFEEAETMGGDDDPVVQRWRKQNGIPDPSSEEGKKWAAEAEKNAGSNMRDHPLFRGGRGGFGGGAAPAAGPKPTTVFDDGDSDSSEGSLRE